MSDTPEEEAPEVPKTVLQRYQARRTPMERRAKTSKSNPAGRSSQKDGSGIAEAIAKGIADGMKEAIAASRDILTDAIVAAADKIEAQRLANLAPEIPYNDRRHTMKIVIEMGWFAVAFAIATALVFPAMGIAASNGQNIGMIIALVYIGVCVVIVYYAAREHFKWAKLYIIREGGILRAVRPDNNFFILAEINAVLNLRTVVSAYETAPWLMRVFGISRIVTKLQETNKEDSEESGGGSGSDENDKKSKKLRWKADTFDFKLMRWTKNGNQLIESISQGSGMA